MGEGAEDVKRCRHTWQQNIFSLPRVDRLMYFCPRCQTLKVVNPRMISYYRHVRTVRKEEP